MASFHYRVGRIVLAIVWAVSLAGSLVECACAVQLNTDDIVISADIGPIAGGEDYGLMRVDPATGDRTIISDATHGSGPTFDFTNHTISSVSRMAGGQLLVSAKNGLFSVDPTTGDRTQINARPTFDAIQVGNQIYAVDRSNLFRVDPTTGNTTNLAAGNETFSLAFANGALYISIEGSILSYSLSGAYLASYPALFSSGAMTATSDGNLIQGSGSGVFNGGAAPVISINPNIPDPFDSHGLPGRSSLYTVTGLGVSPSGTVWAANIPLDVRPIGNVLGIDPTTGNVTTLSDTTHGAGPTFLYPYGLAVVPEPGTFALAAVGGLALLALRRRTNGFHHHAGRIFLAITLAVSLVGSLARCASAVQLNTGDIVISADIGPIAGGEDYGLMRVDPTTGDRTIISDATHGSGPQFDFGGSASLFSNVSRMAGGDLLVSAKNGLFSVDPATGDRTQINSRSTSDAIQVGDQIYAVDGKNLFRVDPTTGNTTNLASPYSNPPHALVYADGALFVSLSSYSLSGEVITFYGGDRITSLAATPDGNVIFSGSPDGVLVGSLNPNVPDPFDYHSIASGTGAPLVLITGLGVASSGTVWAASLFLGGRQSGTVVGIDPTTGNRTLLSDATHGAGPDFLNPYGLTVVPEPGTFILTIVGGLALLALRRMT